MDALKQTLLECFQESSDIESLEQYQMGLAAASVSTADQMLTEEGHINLNGLESFGMDYIKGFIDGVLEVFPHATVDTSLCNIPVVTDVVSPAW